MKALILFLLSFVAINTFADSIPRVHLVHINGINTTQDEACQNLIALQNSIVLNTNVIEWNLDYNPSNTKVIDLLRSMWIVMQQKSREQNIVSINDYVDNYMVVHHLHYPVDSPEYNALKSRMAPDYKAAFDKSAGDDFPAILKNFLEKFPPPEPSDYTGVQDTFLIVPHSQGNLYANALFETLISQYHLAATRIAIFGIASPADSNKGDSITREYAAVGVKNVTSYITSANDFVMGGLKVLYPSLLPPNIIIPYSSSNTLGHNLISTYLSDANAVKQITAMIGLNVGSLAFTLSNFYQDHKTKYYKFMVLQYKDENKGALMGPDGSLICSNGSCNNDFDYYIPQNYELEPGSQVNFAKFFMLPIKKFTPGTYTGLADNDPTGDLPQLSVSLADWFQKGDTHFYYDDQACSTFTAMGYMSFDISSPSQEGPWDQLKTYCPTYFAYDRFIMVKAEIK
ncbi:MAG: hypothetical protein K0R14_706 [Burkholderiales bacterium]|jgi:hypothetical protein|nr:hypothetical protein [Burkholderiales bacterium]